MQDQPTQEKDASAARDLAIRRLSVREYSAAEMRSYLKRKGFANPAIDEVVRELVEDQLISDERYSRVVTRHQAMRDKGPAYIMAKLRQKGVLVDMHRARELYRENLGDEVAKVRSIAEKRYASALDPGADEATRNRAYQGLVRRGFSREAVARCLSRKGDE